MTHLCDTTSLSLNFSLNILRFREAGILQSPIELAVIR